MADTNRSSRFHFLFFFLENIVIPMRWLYGDFFLPRILSFKTTDHAPC